MIVRQLPHSDYSKLNDLFLREFDHLPPVPGMGVVVVAEEEGEIVGVATLQYVLHAEPVWVAPRLRGRGVLLALLRKGFDLVPKAAQGVFCYVKNERNARLVTRLGMEEMADWRVFRWLRR